MVNDKIGVKLNFFNKQIKITVLQREGLKGQTQLSVSLFEIQLKHSCIFAFKESIQWLGASFYPHTIGSRYKTLHPTIFTIGLS